MQAVGQSDSGTASRLKKKQTTEQTISLPVQRDVKQPRLPRWYLFMTFNPIFFKNETKKENVLQSSNSEFDILVEQRSI